jgi:hypothetical protein
VCCPSKDPPSRRGMPHLEATTGLRPESSGKYAAARRFNLSLEDAGEPARGKQAAGGALGSLRLGGRSGIGCTAPPP